MRNVGFGVAWTMRTRREEERERERPRASHYILPFERRARGEIWAAGFGTVFLFFVLPANAGDPPCETASSKSARRFNRDTFRGGCCCSIVSPRGFGEKSRVRASERFCLGSLADETRDVLAVQLFVDSQLIKIIILINIILIKIIILINIKLRIPLSLSLSLFPLEQWGL